MQAPFGLAGQKELACKGGAFDEAPFGLQGQKELGCLLLPLQNKHVSLEGFTSSGNIAEGA